MTLHRPETIDELRKILSEFRSAESRALADDFASRSTDVFISTFPKCGTTWMQQIVHQLRGTNVEEYSDIYEVVPWLESSFDMGIDPLAEQPGQFRAFRSHLAPDQLPTQGRFIRITRDPITVVSSWYKFLEGWFFNNEAITIDEFASDFYLSAFPAHQGHLVSAFEDIDNPNTLVLAYEDMIEKPESVPDVVAKFLDLKVDADTMKGIKHRCSRAYMYEHKSKFEERLFRKFLDKKLGLPPGGESSKINKSKNEYLPNIGFKSALDSLWTDTIENTLGFKSYSKLRGALPNPLNVKRS